MAEKLRDVVNRNPAFQKQCRRRVSHLMPNENRNLCLLAQWLERPTYQVVPVDNLPGMAHENEVSDSSTRILLMSFAQQLPS